MAAQDLARFAVHDLGRLSDEHAHRNHRSLPHDDAFHHFGARADEAIVLDDGGVGLQRLQHTANACACGDMAVPAHLRAGADRGPGIDHGALAHIGAQIDEAGHQHRALGDMRAAPHETAGHRADTGGLEGLCVPSGEFAGHLVPPDRIPGAARDDLHIVQTEGQQHGLFQILMDGPGIAGLFRHAQAAIVQPGQRGVHRLAHLSAGRTIQIGTVLPCLIDHRLHPLRVHHRLSLCCHAVIAPAGVGQAERGGFTDSSRVCA